MPDSRLGEAVPAGGVGDKGGAAGTGRAAAPVRTTDPFAGDFLRDPFAYHAELRVRIGAGEKVLLFLAAANRDPRRWPDPERFDITRRANGHVGFGYGIHACVGAAFARLEGEVLLRALARQVGSLEPAGQPVRRLNNTLSGFAALPLTLRPAGRRTQSTAIWSTAKRYACLRKMLIIAGRARSGRAPGGPPLAPGRGPATSADLALAAGGSGRSRRTRG